MTKITKTLFASLLLGASYLSHGVSAAKCYALGLSSGQESAAFQAGALQGLLDKVSADQMKYFTVSGNTGGAVNTVILASHAQGQEAAAAQKMQQFWLDAGNNKLYQNWWGGIIDGLFTKGGIYDSAPLKTFLSKEFPSANIQRPMSIGIVDVLSGQYLPFTEANLTTGDNLINSLYASFALPGFFPPVQAFNSKWFDGSAVYDLDLFSAINRCVKAGHAQSDIVVDVLLTSSANLKTVDAHDYKSISMLFRFLEINSFYSSMDGLLRAKFAYPKAQFRYAISPTKTLPTSLYPLNLSEDQIKSVIQQGINDAHAAVASGEGQSMDDVIHYHYFKKQGDSRMDKLNLADFIEARRNGEFENVDFENDQFYAKYRILAQ